MLTVSTTLTRKSSAEARSADRKAHLVRRPFCLYIPSQRWGSEETGHFCRLSTLGWTLVTVQSDVHATFFRGHLNLTRATANLNECIFTMGLTFYTGAVKWSVPVSSVLTSTWNALEKKVLWHERMISRLLFWRTYLEVSCAWAAMQEWGWQSYKAIILPDPFDAW